tara:strand:+ start:1672 stop:2361 length:690 start_codon:yes stop_codon:yes gene_type:complete
MSKEDMQRTLCAEFPLLNIQLDTSVVPPVYEFVTTTAYRQLATSIYVAQQDIDLSGYAMQKKTFYPYTSFEQRAGANSAITSATPTEQPYIAEITMISSVPLDDTALLTAVTFTPGFAAGSGTGIASRFDRSVIVHGERKVFTTDSTMTVPGDNNVLRLIDSQTFSSLEPTAADKLYGYRILIIAARLSELNLAFIPASRVLIPGTLSEEPKLEYMMRLKRSYELANQV